MNLPHVFISVLIILNFVLQKKMELEVMRWRTDNVKTIGEVLENKLPLWNTAAKWGVDAQTLKSRFNKLLKSQDLSSEHLVFEFKFPYQPVFTKTKMIF